MKISILILLLYLGFVFLLLKFREFIKDKDGRNNMTYEDTKIKEKADEYASDNDIQALDDILDAEDDYDEDSSYDGMLEVANKHLSKAYEQGYHDALKEMEERNERR